MEHSRKTDGAAGGHQQHQQSHRRSLPAAPTDAGHQKHQLSPRKSVPTAAAAAAVTSHVVTEKPPNESGSKTRRETRKMSDVMSTTVDMKSVVDEEKLSSLSWSDRLRMARSYKEEGNAKYRNYVYNMAIGKYQLALIYLDAETHPSRVGGSKLPTENQIEEWNQLRVDCLNNVAACMLQKDKPDYDQIVDYCRQATMIAPDNVKALYRMGVALFHANKPEEALKVFEGVASLPEGTSGLLESNVHRYMEMCRAVIHRNETSDPKRRPPDSSIQR